ncbi:MAG: MATE family efflux transporter [Clostridia bacterium]|nr:MATE family efflux transporter [Clostridia bacterium]
MTLRKSAAPVDMLSGPILPHLLRFAIPLMLTGVLQLLYNAADLVVVGRYTGHEALAAVGATSSLTNLMLNFFIGISVGANVVISRAIGAADNRKTASATHTAMLLGGIIGVVVGFFGFLLSPTFLTWMGTPAEVMAGASLYLRIITLGFPAALVYNFGAAVLRAGGDTRRPLYFLTVSGLVNVGMNLFLVLVFHLGVAGVAIATITSQYLSALLVIMALRRLHTPSRLSLRRLKIRRDDFIDIVRIGLPAGLQSACFNISNVLIQSSINSFGAVAVAANTASGNIEGFIYTVMDAFAQSVLTFTGQNIGAKQYRRVPSILRVGLLLTLVSALGMGVLAVLFRRPLLHLYTPDELVVDYGAARMMIIALTYFLCGFMNNFSSNLRAMGHSLMPMLTCIGGVCGVRILIIYTWFKLVPSLTVLYLSWPISWIVTTLILLVYWIQKSKELPAEAE